MEFSPQGYAPDGTAIFGKDDQSMVKFFRHPRLGKFASTEAGMPVYDNVEMVEVIQPGEKEGTKVVATEWHRRRFPRQYEAYKQGVEMSETGTPLDHLFPAEPSTIQTLKGFHVFTIQQLAGLTDTAIGNLPMGRQLVDRAKAYLSSAQGGSEFHRLTKENDALRLRLEALEAAQPANPQNPQKRGPGRPPKTMTAAAEGASS